MPDPLTCAIVAGIALSAGFSGGSFFIVLGEKCVIWFRRLTDSFYYHVDVPMGNYDLFISIARWMQPHMRRNSNLPQMLIGLNNTVEGTLEQLAVPAVNECLKVDMQEWDLDPVWIRTLPQCEQNTVNIEGFRVYTSAECMNLFFCAALETAGIVDKTAVNSFYKHFVEGNPRLAPGKHKFREALEEYSNPRSDRDDLLAYFGGSSP